MSKKPKKQAAAPATESSRPMHHVFVRATHGQTRVVDVRHADGRERELHWISPTGHELEVDADTLAAFRADPILQVLDRDAPSPKPINLVEMPGLAGAAPQGDQAAAAQPMPQGKVDPSVLPIATKTITDAHAAATDAEGDDESEEVDADFASAEDEADAEDDEPSGAA